MPSQQARYAMIEAMKQSVKKIVMAISALSLALGVYAWNDFQRARSYEPEFKVVAFNQTPLTLVEASWRVPWFFGLFEWSGQWLRRTEEDQFFKLSTLDHYLEGMEGFTLELLYEDELTTFEPAPSSVRLERSGVYRMFLKHSSPQLDYVYQAQLELELPPEVSISKLSAQQGDVLVIRVDHIHDAMNVELKAPFKPSAPLRTKDAILWFMPVVYRQTPGTYPIEVTIDETFHSYELEVLAYDFKALYFTVDTSVVRSTVGNPAAVEEYRTVIWPTYETYEPNNYWNDPFMLPVEGARISSTFGEMRFVNNAPNPTRHVGIDYAIACGTDVRASNRGRVEVSQFLIMIGNTIVIDHGLGLKTYYEHMEELFVQPGEMVERGQVIGTVGTTGYSTGCHLHFQAMIKNQSFNPEFLYELRKTQP